MKHAQNGTNQWKIAQNVLVLNSLFNKLSLFFSAKYAFCNANSHRTLRSSAHGWSSDDFTEINHGLTALLL